MLKDIAISKSELTEAAAKKSIEEEKATDYEKGFNKGIIANRENAQKRLKLLVSNLIKNKDGVEVRLSSNNVNKLVSGKSVGISIKNGFTASQHFAAAANIDNLFKNSSKILTHTDRDNDPNIKAMHRFVAPLFGNNVAFITVKESVEHGKRIYSIELMEIGELEGKVNRVKTSSTQAAATSSPIS